MKANSHGLAYTAEEFAKEIGTRPENISILMKLNFIKPITFGPRSRKISIYEAERFLVENAGKDFTEIIEEYKKRKLISEMSGRVVPLREA